MDKQSADDLRQFLISWQNTHAYSCHFQDPQLLADELGKCVQFETIRIAGWLESPQGASIAQVVESAMPFPMNLEAQTMTAAIEIAARRRTSDQAVLTLVVGLIAVLLIWGIFSLASFQPSTGGSNGQR
jgi:hypothetical protein